MSFGSWEDSQHAVPKLETQESQWYKPACVRKPESQELWCLTPGKMDVPAQEKRENLPFLHLFFYLGPQWTGRCPQWWGKSPASSAQSNAHLFQKQPCRSVTLFYHLPGHPRAQSRLPLLMRKFLSGAWSYPRVIHRTSFCTGWLAHAILQQASNSTAAAWGLGSQLVLLLPLLPLWSLWYPVC